MHVIYSIKKTGNWLKRNGCLAWFPLWKDSLVRSHQTRVCLWFHSWVCVCFTAWCCKVLSARVCVSVWERDRSSDSGLACKKVCLLWSNSLESKSSACEHAHGNKHAHLRPAYPANIALLQSASAFYFWYISRYSIFHCPFCRKLTYPIKPCLQPDSLSPKTNTLIHCSLPSPSLSSLCHLHYSPLIVKSFCSISTHPFYKHTLLIFLICIHFKSRSTFCSVVQFFWKPRNHLTGLVSGLLK